MCSSQVFHCLLNCLGPGTLLPIQRSVQHLVSHTAVTLVGSSLLHKATSAPETLDPFVEVLAGLYSVSRCGGVTFYMQQVSRAGHTVTHLCQESFHCQQTIAAN